MIRSIIAHHCAEKFAARLAGIVIWTDCPLLGKNIQGGLESMKIDTKHKIHAKNIQDVFFLRVPNRRRQLPPVAQLGGHCNRVKGRFWVNNSRENRVKGRFWVIHPYPQIRFRTDFCIQIFIPLISQPVSGSYFTDFAFRSQIQIFTWEIFISYRE